MKNKSIFTVILIYFLLFSIIMVGILWLVQMNFMPQYYYNEKVNIIKNYGLELEKMVGDSKIDEQSISMIHSASERINARIVVYNKNGQMIHNEGMIGQQRMIRVPHQYWQQVLDGKIIEYQVEGTRGSLESLVVVIPGSHYIYLFQTQLQVIEDAIAITRGFYFYLLAVGLILTIMLAIVFSKKITDPLIKLNQVASKMALLESNILWEDNRRDEIGQLGKTINSLTGRLKKTIGQLEVELEKEKSIEKMRKEFVARVSHELQTPIAIISGYVEALRDGIPVAEYEREEFFEIIEEEINNISRLVKDMLDLGQLESGTFKINEEVFDYCKHIDKTISKFEVFKNEKQLKFEIEGLPSNCLVYGDQYRIEQVLTNLIHNAVNFALPGSNVKLSINDEGSKLWTGIYNEGEKIPFKDLPYVWDSFYKGSSKKTGTGLGLAIVKSILDLHGNEYGVENTDTGVCFYFYIKKHQ